MIDNLRRGGGPRTLGTVMPRAASSVLRKRGFAQGAIVARWSEIVGPELAAQSAPERLVFPRDGTPGGATLHVRAGGALALELQHLAPIVLERVNGFFGYQAVARLSLHQAPLPKATPRPPKRRPRELASDEKIALDTAVSGMADPELRTALRSLGQRVAESQPVQKNALPKRPK